MALEQRPDVDRRLRDAFSCAPEAVDRVVGAALAPVSGRPPHRWLGVVAASAVVVLAAALALWPSPPVQDPKAAAELVLSGVLADGVLVVSLPDGSVSISDGDAREDRPPDGSGIILVEGGIK